MYGQILTLVEIGQRWIFYTKTFTFFFILFAHLERSSLYIYRSKLYFELKPSIVSTVDIISPSKHPALFQL
jgi:hypothetical protein